MFNQFVDGGLATPRAGRAECLDRPDRRARIDVQVLAALSLGESAAYGAATLMIHSSRRPGDQTTNDSNELLLCL